MMYCDGNMKLEENFGKLLPTITKYQVKGHFLTLKNKNGQTIGICETLIQRNSWIQHRIKDIYNYAHYNKDDGDD